MSLRQESLRAYRELFRGASRSSRDCALYNTTGLQSYVSKRFGEDAERNRLQLSAALNSLGSTGTKQLRKKKGSLKQARSKLLDDYQAHISKEIDRSRALAQTFDLAPGHVELTSVLQALSAGVGNKAYQQLIESSVLQFFEHEEKRVSRDEVAEDATSERQNRIMVQALLPYAERLLLVHRTAIGEQNRDSSLIYLSPWQVSEAIVGNRSGVSAIHLRVGRDHLVVEIDETYNKQVVYLCSTRGDGGDSGSYEWSQEVERVEISESEDVQKTLFHSEYLIAASRICDSLLQDSPLHPSRKTVIIGHAVGGAVGLALSLILAQRGFEISNTISLGAPKVLQGTLERYVSAVNPVRVVLAGDPLVELPITGAEGAPFVHVGEILVLSPRTAAEKSKRKLRASEPPEGNGEPFSEGFPTKTDAFTAESLHAILDDGDNSQYAGEVCSPLDTTKRSLAKVQKIANGSSDNGEDEMTEKFSVAAQRYRQNFLIEHYVQQLQDPRVELTYAEGDEVWDDGEYEEMKRRMKQTSPVIGEEQRLRDLRGPL